MPTHNAITILPVAYTDRAMRDFIHLPWLVQSKDPLWVPPLLIEHHKVLNPKRGPFFEFGTAQYFLALRDGQPVGRISAHLNPQHEARYQDQSGFFGFFECVQDQEVANALLDAAAAWVRERGKRVLLGPLGFTIYDEVGCLVHGFETMPAVLQVHNPPWYQELLTTWGLTKAIDWHAVKVFGLNRDMPDVEQNIAAMQHTVDAVMAKTHARMFSPTIRQMYARADEVKDLFNATWEGNWGHVPFTSAQFRRIIMELRPMFRKNMVRFILDPQDKLLAFLVSVPDVNPAIQKLNGRLRPLGLLRVLWSAKFAPLSRVRTLIMGVQREHQGRQLHHALIMDLILSHKYTPPGAFSDCSLIAETNRPLLRALKRYNGEIYKTWRLFTADL